MIINYCGFAVTAASAVAAAAVAAGLLRLCPTSSALDALVVVVSSTASVDFPPGQLLRPPNLPPTRLLLLLTFPSRLSACPPQLPTSLLHLHLNCPPASSTSASSASSVANAPAVAATMEDAASAAA